MSQNDGYLKLIFFNKALACSSSIIFLFLIFFQFGCAVRLLEELEIGSTEATSSPGSSYMASPASFLRQLGANTIGVAAGDYDGLEGITIDSSGNIYIGGVTDGSLGENKGANQDVFVAKFNRFGEFQWVSQLGADTLGAAADDVEFFGGIVTDSNGNVYISGYTRGSLAETNGGSGEDIFLVKYNPNGDFQWVKQLGNATLGAPAAGADSISGMVIDSSDKIYAAGHSSGSFGETNGGGGSPRDIILMKWDTDGNLIWRRQMGNATIGGTADNGQDNGYSLVLDQNSNSLYIGGSTNGSLGETLGGGIDVILAKYDTDGNFQWVRQMGNTTIGGAADNGVDGATTVALTPEGDIILGGDTFGSLGEANGGSGDVFIAKYLSNGVFQWVKQLGDSTIGGTADDGNEEVHGMQIDATGNIYVVGNTPGALGETNGGLSDAFLAKFDSFGTLTWIKQLGDVTVGGTQDDGNESARAGLVMDSSGALYFGGGTNGSFGETVAGSYDAYLCKMTSDGELDLYH